jgi:peptidoglycan/LPS O-acetylase OafA/YrhL
MGSLPSLTGLRGFAALWVVAFHWFAISGPRLLFVPNPFAPNQPFDVTSIFTAGWLGVHIFFCLSAFLLSFPFVAAAASNKPLPDLKHYFSRRFLRVLPAYYFQLIILLLLSLIGLWEVNNQGRDMSAIALHFFMLQGVSSKAASAINDVYWTLPVEILYYLLMPIMIFVLSAFGVLRLRRALWLLVLVLVVVQLIRYAAFTDVAAASIPARAWRLGQLDALADVFIAGTVASMAYYVLRDHDVARSWAVYVAIALGIIGMLALGALIHRGVMAYWNGSRLLLTTSTVGALSTALLVVGLAFADRTKRWTLGLGTRPMQWLGSRSFSLYLWHDPVLKWTHRAFKSLGVEGDLLWPLLFVAIPIAFLFAEISYRLVELPFQSGTLPWRRSATGAPPVAALR